MKIIHDIEKIDDGLKINQTKYVDNMPRCNFCFGRNPRDPFTYTHFLRDPHGCVTCPFLKLIRCRRCGECGHVEPHCKASQADVLSHQMDVMSMDGRPPPWNPGGARIFCNFCYNYDANDRICESHHTHDPRTGELICPRLLNNRCNYCGGRGHTPRFCEKRERDRRPPPEPDDPSLIVTFTDSEDEDDAMMHQG